MSLVVSIGLFIFAALGHGYLWTDAVNRMHAWPGPRKLIDVLTYGCLAAFLILPLAVLLCWGDVSPFGDATSDSTYGWAHWYLLFCAVWGAGSLVVSWLRRYATDSPRIVLNWQQEPVDVNEQLGDDTLRPGMAQTMGVVPGNQVLQLTIDRKRLAIPQLGSRHEGLKIAHISDLHMTGRLGPNWYEVVAEQVNRLEADAIAITGDIVENEACWPWLADSLGTLKAKHGVYFVLGNHDFYIDAERTKRLLQDQGLMCLSETSLETQWNDAPIYLVGNERPWVPHVADAKTTTSGDTDTRPLQLALMHTPDQFNWAVERGCDLALAGHTHGGQLRFPVLGPVACPSRYGTRYACGVFRRSDTVMHVSRGVSGKMPLRWNCPPEIALLELVRG